MKIAVYYNLSFGGAKRAVQEHVKGLSALGHHVDVYTQDSEKDSFSPGLYANNSFIYHFSLSKFSLPLVSRIVRDYQTFVTLKNLHKTIANDIDKKNYDIVLAHADTYTQTPYLVRFLKTKNVYYCMEPLRMVYEYSLRIPKSLSAVNKVYELINRQIRKNIDRVNARSCTYSLAISYFCRAYMILVYDIYSTVSYLGVDTVLFHPINVKKKKQIVYVAPKENLFGYDLLEKALQLIPKQDRPEVKIIFGAEKGKRITDEEVVKAYNESLVTVSLSKLDTFGLVPLESMACGTPVIASNVAGYTELIIDKSTGYLIEFEPSELAERIMEFMHNPELSRKMGETGRKRVLKHWRWEKQIKQLEDQLTHFVNQK